MDLMRLSSLCKSAGDTCTNRDEPVKVVQEQAKYSLLCQGSLAMDSLLRDMLSRLLFGSTFVWYLHQLIDGRQPPLYFPPPPKQKKNSTVCSRPATVHPMNNQLVII